MKSARDERPGIVPENRAEMDFLFEVEMMYVLGEALNSQMIRVNDTAKRLGFRFDFALMNGLGKMVKGYQILRGYIRRENKTSQFAISGCGDALTQTFRLLVNNSKTGEDVFKNYCFLKNNTKDCHGHDISKYEEQAFDTLLNTTADDVRETRSWLR